MTLNQPAGHLEDGESLIEAVIRETSEETAWQFEPAELIGIYRWQAPESKETYIRYCFTGTVLSHDPTQTLDVDIHQALWLPKDELISQQRKVRETSYFHWYGKRIPHWK